MSFTIAHLSDAHLSPAPFPPFGEMRLKRFMGYRQLEARRASASMTWRCSARLVADLRAHHPDHVAMTGDVVNIALQAEFHRAVDWMKTLGEPADVSFTPGNHDAYVRDAMDGPAQFVRALDDRRRRRRDLRGVYPYLRVRGEVALIGLNSGVPTAPLLASGPARQGATRRASRSFSKETGAQGLARVVLIHHPPLVARARACCAASTTREASRRRSPNAAPRRSCMAIRTSAWSTICPPARRGCVGGKVPVIGVPSCSAGLTDAQHRAAYYLVSLERAGAHWRISARARGPLGGAEIGEQEPLAL